LESRKHQLQKQIIEALQANDNDLYSLLKSQWAHRFGVESLEELNNLDLKKSNQNSANLDNQKIDQSLDNEVESDKTISLEDMDKQDKEISTGLIDSLKEEHRQSFKNKSNQAVYKENHEKKFINNQLKENKNQPVVQTLIPLPPKPKYGYLKKWMLRN
tara:strand:+ start:54 stop:530 length:477 start_codon:yes stop_codon:yes gene_type:complete